MPTEGLSSTTVGSRAKANWKRVLALCLLGGGVGLVFPLVLGRWSANTGLVALGLLGVVVCSVLFSPPMGKIRVDLFAPYVLFPLMWITAVAASSLQLTIFQEPWDTRMWLTVGLALISYLIGVSTVLSLRDKWPLELRLRDTLRRQWNETRLKQASVALLLISTAFLAYEYRITGSIPLLSPNIELVRFDAIAGGYVDTLATSARIVIMLLGVHILSKPRLRIRENLFSLALIAVATGLMASTARRGTVVFPFVVILVAYHYLRKNVGLRRAILLGVVGFVAVALYSHYRYARTFGSAPLKIAWRPERFSWLTLGYMSISDNFRTLRLLTETIPDQVPFQGGRFTTYGLYSVFPGHQENLGEFQNRIWGWERYSGSVSTYLGPFYVDFGLVGVIVGSFLIGILAMFVYDRLKSRPSSYLVLLYSYMGYCLMFMTFSNPFTWTLTYWDVVAFTLVNLYARRGQAPASGVELKSHSRPGLTAPQIGRQPGSARG